jgi:uncharacterized protein YdcH (DUF465 family)
MLPGEFRTRKVVLMESNQDELKAHLMATNEEYRSLADRHAEYHKQLEAIEAKSPLSMEDEAEEQRLKKQKLRLKDQMNQIVAQYRTQRVA